MPAIAQSAARKKHQSQERTSSLLSAMSQSREFFGALARAIHSKETATLSATTACWRLASVSIEAGEIFALRYGDQVGPDALPAFKSIQVERVFRKPDCSNLLYKPAEKPVSTQNFINVLRDRAALETSKATSPEASSTAPAVEPSPKQSPATPLKYRGKPVSPVNEVSADTQKKSAKVRTWAMQYSDESKPQLNYRGKPVRPVSQPDTSSGQDSPPTQTWETQYRGNGTNPFRRRDRGDKRGEAA